MTLPLRPFFALRSAVFATLVLASTAWAAPEFTKGAITVDRPYAMPTAAAQPHGVVFLEEVRNSAKTSDQIVGARSSISKSMEVHRMSMEHNVMKMREIPAIEIPASGTIRLPRGNKEGYHLMLMNLVRPLKEGDTFPVTIVFKQAGELEVMVRVERPSAPMDHGHMKH